MKIWSGMRWGEQGGQAILSLPRSRAEQSLRSDASWTLTSHDTYKVATLTILDNVVPIAQLAMIGAPV